MKSIRWGIIGCGDVTEVKSGPGFQKAQGSQLVAVMRRNAELAEDYARRHGVPKWYSSAEELMLDPEVDAIYIATPPANHKSYTLQAALTGKPVYVEKPMGLGAQEGNEMIEACKQAGVPLFVAYYRRALPRFLKIKELLEQGAIGQVRAVTSQQFRKSSEQERSGKLSWRLQPEISGSGYFRDLASHTLDLLDDLLGPIEEAAGYKGNQGGYYEAEDTVSGTYRFASGVHGIGLWCFDAAENREWTEIVGSEGKIIFSTFEERPIRLKRGGEEQRFDIPHPAHIQQPLIQMMVDQLSGRGGVCPSTGESAARTNAVMDRLLQR